MAHKNYSKMSTQPVVDQEPVVDPEQIAMASAPDPEPSAPADVTGIVVGCSRLNIRKEPSTSATILCEVTGKSELCIYPDKSTDEWYSVCTPAGVEGFCMKKFVALA